MVMEPRTVQPVQLDAGVVSQSSIYDEGIVCMDSSVEEFLQSEVQLAA